jgi:aryl carrier-like protein
MNLPAEFRKEGMRVRFEVKELKNQASFHMWGIIVEIVHIQSL